MASANKWMNHVRRKKRKILEPYLLRKLKYMVNYYGETKVHFDPN